MDKTLSSSAPVVQVCFPNVRAQVLDNLNRQREEGRLCDLSIQVQGQVFRAHRCVLAASSPYFHDQVLLKNVSTVSLPSVMDPLVFESVLNSAYTGQLSIVRDDIVNYVTVASFLQMWHIVDKCTDILKRSRPLTQASPGVESGNSRHQSPSSSDCCLTEPEEQKKPLAGECAALPPLATWRRPQQVPHHGKWGKSRLFLPPQHRADSPPAGEMERASSPEAANEKRNWVRSRLRESREVDEEDRRRGERWMEADEGVGEESELEEEERRAGGCGSGATLKKEGESGGEGQGAERGKDQQEGYLAAAQDAEEVLVATHCPISGRAQWQPAADWSTGPCAQPGGKLIEDAEKDVEEVDFGRFTEGGFEGETYDEIEDGTGQVSQRPLLPVSPGNAGGMDFVLGPSELPWTSGALSSPSVPPSSSPVPSSSSPPSLAPYAGKVHFCHCGKAFTLKSMRDRHVKMQHLNLRPFACPVCAKSFKMKHHLTKHVKTHGALRPYECNVCGKKIIWRDSFLKHQARCQHLANRSVCADTNGAESDQDKVELEYEGYPGEGHVKMEQGEHEEAPLEHVLKEEDGGSYT
ncbi:zinc finger and BTB domain-containing protein 22 [Hemibagrus wyckioides]|nr:zinc finger and BTB domain-containing protein 22 [Hemibagrus wyckioides]XP_058264432.1 zinc finger and BTB domain-containing protein 22 [Hemibagrus wyckioides]XP_058264433.1 zinc finger and BTB domain-containing protein 22 [Hemibagrus wyckioides]